MPQKKKNTSQGTRKTANEFAKVMGAKPTRTSSDKSTFSELVWMVVAFTICGMAVTYIASMLFPMAVVLGNAVVSPFMALFYSMLITTLIGVGVMPLVEMVSSSLKIKMSMPHYIVLYAIVNAAALWIVSRFAEQVGLGLSSAVVIVVLAVVLDLVQGFAVTMIMPKRK
jgi:hypothetical protein